MIQIISARIGIIVSQLFSWITKSERIDRASIYFFPSMFWMNSEFDLGGKPNLFSLYNIIVTALTRISNMSVP